MNEKALKEQRVELEEKMENILNVAKNEGRAMNEDEIANFDEMEKEIKNIDATLARKERVEKMENKEIVKDLTREEKDIKAMADIIRNNASDMTKGANGTVIPSSIARKIIDKVIEISPLYASATKYNDKGTLIIPKVDTTDDDVTVAYATEFSDLTAHSNKFATVSLTGFLIGALTKISKSLLNNSDFNLVNYVVNRMAEKFKVFYENEILNGTENKIAGIVGTYDSTNMKVELSKKSTITSDELIDIQELVPDMYQEKAYWIMNKETRKKIRKLKDGQGNYLLNRVFDKNWEYELLGRPVHTTTNCTALGTASKEVIFYGDFSGVAVKETENMEFQILNELYATQHAVGVCAYAELDAKVENVQKIAVAVSGAND